MTITTRTCSGSTAVEISSKPLTRREQELGMAQFQGRHVAIIATKLFG